MSWSAIYIVKGLSKGGYSPRPIVEVAKDVMKSVPPWVVVFSDYSNGRGGRDDAGEQIRRRMKASSSMCHNI